MPPDPMKAWQLPAFGLAHLAYGERPVPVLGPGEVLVRVGAVSLNYRDRLVVEGKLLPSPPAMPFVPVSDFAGRVVAVGADVDRVAPGARVMGHFWTDWLDGPAPAGMTEQGRSLGGPLPGALAEYVAIPAAAAVPVPETLSDVEAATLPVAALTAWFALTETGRTKPGDVVVVEGTGGVAMAGLQLATALGARVVVTSRSATKRAGAADLGAWATVDTIAYPAWSDRVRALTGGRGADHVLEIIGGAHVREAVAALAPEGRISLIGFLGGNDVTVPALPLMLKRAGLRGVSVGHRRAFEAMAAFMRDRDLHPVVDRVFAFADAPAAFERLAAGPLGKVVIAIDA